MTTYLYQVTISEPTQTRTLLKSSPLKMTRHAIEREFGVAGGVVLSIRELTVRI